MGVVVVDLDTTLTQAQFGDLIGISQQAVSDLCRRRILREGESARTWLVAYCEHLRDIAAGRGGEGALELATERARLAREQADKIAMQNAVTRGALAPAYLLEEVLARAGARAARILDTIPGEIRRRVPQLGSDDISAVARIVAKARNIAAAMKLSDIESEDEGDGDEGVVLDAEAGE